MNIWNHFINGTFRTPIGGGYLDEYNPRTRERSFSIARGNAEDVDAAVRAAQQAWPGWRDKRPSERAKVLLAIARQLREEREALATLDEEECGRPRIQALAEADLAAQYFDYYGGLINLPRGEVIDLGADYHSYTRREPFGVVGVILPWNGALNQSGRAIAPAIAAGNVVVAKPSEFTSITMLALAKLAFAKCGLPAGVLNVVTGTGPEVGAALVSHEGVRKVSFTGSLRAGREVGAAAADRVIPVSLELGGKSPNIVFSDAHLDSAAAGTIRAFTANSGQACSAGSRCLVERTIYDEFVKKLEEAVSKVTIGSDDSANMGPIITRTQYEKVQSYCDLAKSEGAKLFMGGTVQDEAAFRRGWYVRPVILTDVQNDMRIAREEIFGPVVCVIPFANEQEAVRIANDTNYGLAAGLWTSDVQRAHRVAAQLEAGQIFINEYFAGGVETPFGGFKQSGHGREKGVEALHHYTQVKCVTLKL